MEGECYIRSILAWVRVCRHGHDDRRRVVLNGAKRRPTKWHVWRKVQSVLDLHIVNIQCPMHRSKGEAHRAAESIACRQHSVSHAPK